MGLDAPYEITIMSRTKGSKHSLETIERMKRAQNNRSIEWKKNIAKAKIGKARPNMMGNNNPSWKGGITPISKKIRHSIEYKLWRTAVFERDSYTCIWCGLKGVYIEADHIKSFAYFPELRFAIDNGRTLCKSCHETTDTYKGRNNRRKSS